VAREPPEGFPVAISARPQEWNATRPAAAWWQSALAKRRVPISLAVFTSLVLADMFLLHVRPRDIFDFSDPGTVIGQLLVLCGLGIRAWAAGTLKKCQSLIRMGPYALVRNPLYLGSLLMMCGFCTLVHDWLAMWLAVVPIVAVYWMQVRHEERMLAKWFPDEWSDYAATTPRFIPRRLSASALQGWSLAQWIGNREYQALLASAVAMGGLVIWRWWTR
jgi:protein-S-isoprenylcysteine O-methyltransferase Ste14